MHASEPEIGLRTKRVSRQRDPSTPPRVDADDNTGEFGVRGTPDDGPPIGTIGQIGATPWERVGRWCVYAAALLAPFFFLPWTLVPVDLNKQFLLFILSLAAAAAYVADAVASRRLIYPRSLVAVGVLGVVVATGVSAALSRVPFVSFYGGLTQPESALAFLSYGLLFLAGFRFIRTDVDAQYRYIASSRGLTVSRDALDARRLGIFFLSGVAVASMITLLQLFGLHVFPWWQFTRSPGFNPSGTFTGWGVLISLALVLLLHGGVRDEGSSNVKRATFEVKTRGLAMVVTAAILFIASLFVLNYRIIWILLALLSLGVAAEKFSRGLPAGLASGLAAISIVFASLSNELPRIAEVPGEVRPSISTTIAVVRETLSGARVLVGSGPSTFGYEYSRFRPQAVNDTGLWNIRFLQGHDFVGTLFVTGGVTGVLAFLFLIFSLLRSLWATKYGHGQINEDNIGESNVQRVFDVQTRDLRCLDEIRAAWAATLFLFGTLFFLPASATGLAFAFIALGVATSLSGARGEFNFAPSQRWQSALGVIVGAPLFALGIAVVYFVGARYAGAVLLAQGITARQEGETTRAIRLIESAVRLSGDSDEALRALSQTLLSRAEEIARDPSQGAPGDTVQAAALAVDTARRATTRNDLDSLNWTNAGEVYEALIGIATNAETFAEDSYAKASERDPMNPVHYVNVGRVRLARGNFEGALDAFRKALEKRADFAPAHFLIAQAHFGRGDTRQAIAEAQTLRLSAPFDVGLAFQLGFIYYQNNEFGEARTEFERAVALNENYSNARYFLGLIYDREGRREEAIEQFERIAALNPGNAEVERILRNLREGRNALQDVAPPAPPPEKRRVPPVEEKSQ